VAQVAGEEGHLIDTDDHHALGGGQHGDRGLDLFAGQAAGRLLEIRVVGAQRSLELGVIEVEQRPVLRAAVALLGGVAVLLDRRLLKLGIAVEAQRLGEAHDGRRRGAGAPRQLLRGQEGRLVEMVDDVARHVLLRAGELVEALGDEAGQALALRTRPCRGPGHGAEIRPCNGFPFRRRC